MVIQFKVDEFSVSWTLTDAKTETDVPSNFKKTTFDMFIFINLLILDLYYD